jgi:hypothetical protein
MESYYRSNEMHAPCTSGYSDVLDYGKYELSHMTRARNRWGTNDIEDILQTPSLQDVILLFGDDTNFELSEL